jgi:hypothetical protein
MMNRRRFLRIGGAAAAGPVWVSAITGAAPPGATVLYDDRSIALARTAADPHGVADALWVPKDDLPRINGFEIKPQGVCRGDVCVPVPAAMTRGRFFNLTAFSRKIGQAVVADAGARIWSFGEIPAFQGGLLSSRRAPDFSVPDRRGRPVHLSDFRGKKVLVVTWASW